LAPAFSWFLAWRYLVSRRINLLGMFGVAVAVWALIVVIAVFSGFIGEIRAGARLASPDLLLDDVRAGCDFATLAKVLEKDPDVAAIAPRVKHHVILSAYGHHARYRTVTRSVETSPIARSFVRLLGIDPAAEAKTTELSKWLHDLRPEDTKLAVEDVQNPFSVSEQRTLRALRDTGADLRVPRLGNFDALVVSARRLTRGEPILLGSRIDVITGRFQPTATGEHKVHVSRKPTVLSGAFHTGHRTFDDMVVLADIEFVRRILGYAADESDVALCTEVAMKLRPGADAGAAAARLQASVAPICGGRVLTWQAQNATFLAAVDQERNMMKVCLFAVMLVAGFLIYATLHMMVTQKVRDIGVLTALGATPHGVQMIFLTSGLTIALLGGCLGTGAGIASAVYLNPVNDFARLKFGRELFPTDVYALDHIPYELDARWIVQVFGAALVLALVVAWLPARRAAKLHPVEALSKG
jgi:lipoprotein-releasing system permease protein